MATPEAYLGICSEKKQGGIVIAENTTTTTTRRRSRRATIAGVLLTALAAGTAMATAAPASATTNTREIGVRIWSMPTAAASQLTTTSHASTAARSTAAASLVWIDVVSVVGGARVRAIPINGTILRLIPYGGRASALCRIPANDGYDWTWLSYAGIKGWVRNDLIVPVQYTYPGAPPFRPVPRC